MPEQSEPFEFGQTAGHQRSETDSPWLSEIMKRRQKDTDCSDRRSAV